MGKRNVSRCTVPARNEEVFVKVVNSNEQNSRQFAVNAYDKESENKTPLLVFAEDKQMKKDNLGPGSEKLYKIQTADVKNKIIFEIIQEGSGGGIGVSTNNKGLSNVVIRLK
ncbi:hypothetical protein K8O68_11035 [Salipaludibacillus sp. CUR1]|uniref:hypothetical protein n=1 Tax=Salipaludibacillus sp. CUR1 TaxID=2820003 RepID=UPI001E31BD31|nr:hypothetical protein [Salipaludibacillus sp. CUR1]MCE7792950.1 hypothetical protein [Salipaludibacillus sp. CUR1]